MLLIALRLSSAHHAEPQLEPPQPDPRPRVLALGVVTAPANAARRRWLRHTTQLHTGGAIVQRFLVGTDRWGPSLAEEAARTRDILLVEARDGSAASCVEKSFAWWLLALSLFPRAEYIAKTDDDSFNNLRQLHHAVRRFPPGMVYAGWPQYSSFLPERNQACGWGASSRHALSAAASPKSNCHPCDRLPCFLEGRRGGTPLNLTLYGPYVFATGALELLSRPLAAQVFGLEWTRRWVGANQLIAADGPRAAEQARWLKWKCYAEDSLVGYAVSAAVSRLRAHATFVSLGGVIADASAVVSQRLTEAQLARMLTVHKLEMDEEKRRVEEEWEDHMNELRRQRGQRVEYVKHKLHNDSRELLPRLRAIGEASPSLLNFTPADGWAVDTLSCFSGEGRLAADGSVAQTATGLAGEHAGIRALFTFPDWRRGWRFWFLRSDDCSIGRIGT
ncbi:hypothetical protein AB1Y20_007629 [Prymnesium parvum]|uniref:Hexosyltransferase n=1 Tax=Prymnesium parvum TaxID=97485 RepID=A0AB34IXI2_PRYPA